MKFIWIVSILLLNHFNYYLQTYYLTKHKITIINKCSEINLQLLYKNLCKKIKWQQEVDMMILSKQNKT